MPNKINRLGYLNSKLWDANDLDQKAWNTLNEGKKEAADVLGYNEETWNKMYVFVPPPEL